MNTIEILESRIAPATIVVTNNLDNGPGSLRAALALADDPSTHSGHDTIAFHFPPMDISNGATIIYLTTGALTSKGNVTIIGPGPGRLIIDGTYSDRVFDFDDGSNSGPTATDSPIAISGLSIINGKTSGSGGGIYSTESLTLKNVVISGNIAGINGGGVSAGAEDNLVKVAISGSLITGNSAANVGGGLNLFSLKSLNFTRSTIIDNVDTSTIHGAGGVYAGLSSTGAGMTISGCQISGNTADHGGGVFITSYNPAPKARMTISASTISGNTAAGKGQGGGGLYIEFGNAVVTRSSILENSSVYNGGGIEANGFASLTISACTISGNSTSMPTSGQGGAGLCILGASTSLLPVKITGTLIDGNRTAAVGSNGGGISAGGGIALTISSSSIFGNSCGSRGGGIYTSGEGAGKVNLVVNGGTISNNFADQDGGGLLTNGSGSVFITGSKVTGNHVSSECGGGLYFTTTAPVILKNVVATGNFGVAGGGLYFVATPDFQVIGGSFSGNDAYRGAGIYATGSGGSILGVTIFDNAATLQGGGLFEVDSDNDITLHLTKITGNTAPTGPNTYGKFLGP